MDASQCFAVVTLANLVFHTYDGLVEFPEVNFLSSLFGKILPYYINTNCVANYPLNNSARSIHKPLNFQFNYRRGINMELILFGHFMALFGEEISEIAFGKREIESKYWKKAKSKFRAVNFSISLQGISSIASSTFPNKCHLGSSKARDVFLGSLLFGSRTPSEYFPYFPQYIVNDRHLKKLIIG